MSEHTATPWHLGTDGHVYAGETGRDLIAEVSHGQGDESVKGGNGRFIVSAANHYVQLLVRLKVRTATCPCDGSMNRPDLYCDLCVDDLALIAKAEADR